MKTETTTERPGCEACGQSYTTAESCTYDDEIYPYGEEPLHGWAHQPDRCRDCNVAIGGLHHPPCCVAQCMRCDRQAIGCECDDQDDADDGEGLHRAVHLVAPWTHGPDQTPIRIAIDENIAPLVDALWAARIVTLTSCQGGITTVQHPVQPAYVDIYPNDAQAVWDAASTAGIRIDLDLIVLAGNVACRAKIDPRGIAPLTAAISERPDTADTQSD